MGNIFKLLWTDGSFQCCASDEPLGLWNYHNFNCGCDLAFGNKYYTSSSTYPDSINIDLKTDNKIIEMMTCSNADAFPT